MFTFLIPHLSSCPLSLLRNPSNVVIPQGSGGSKAGGALTSDKLTLIGGDVGGLVSLNILSLDTSDPSGPILNFDFGHVGIIVVDLFGLFLLQCYTLVRMNGTDEPRLTASAHIRFNWLYHRALKNIYRSVLKRLLRYS